MLRILNVLRIILITSLCLLLLGQAIPAFADELPPPPPSDALIPPAEVLSRRAMAPLGPGTSDAPGYYDTSVYAIGTVAVGLILPESNGTGDANTEDWTVQEIAAVTSEVQEALTWWETQAPPAAKLDFVLDSAAPRVAPTSYEPINHPQSDEGKWISQTLGNIGYGGSNYFDQSYAYINALRAQYHTDWAYIIFVADSSNDPDGYFSDMYFAYAYLGGPFMVMTYDNDGWGIGNMGQVAAHETGHIFLAGDQYTGSGCTKTQRYGYLGVQHSWCADANPSLMKGGYVLSNGDPARGQFGWRDGDGDGVPDPIDASPTVTLPAHFPDPTTETTLAYSGNVEANPYPHYVGCSPYYYCASRDVTLQTVSDMAYQVDGGAWQALSPSDGAFDEQIEEFTFTAGPLLNGDHTITASGTSAFNRNGGTPATVIGTASDLIMTGTSNLPGPGVYNDKHTGWTYTGAWYTYLNAKAYGGSYRYSAKIGNAASFSFVGSKFALSYAASTAFRNLDIFVDNVKVTTLNQYSATAKWQQKYTSPSYTEGVHTVRFVHASGTRVNVDAIQIYGPPDIDPPAAITDLAASFGPSNGSVNLSWSAPAEDASTGTGTAASYLVRYSPVPINAGNWDAANVVTSGIPVPGAPGAPQQMTVNLLSPGVTYYFAVRAQDEEPNLAGMSNIFIMAAKSPAPLGVGKYDDKHASWVYFGTWGAQLNARAYGGSLKHSTKIGNSASFVFTGTNFILGYAAYTTYGTMDVYVDGLYSATINLAGASAMKTFTLPAPLIAGQHTVQFVHRSGARVNVDAIEIMP